MRFIFDAEKATQVAVSFAQSENGRINIMKLIKLSYLLDRHSFLQRGIPVIGGVYFSMKNGPVISELLDLINSGYLYGYNTDWSSFFNSRSNHDIQLKKNVTITFNALSKAEVKYVNFIYSFFGGMNQFQLSEWCHDNCNEWHRISSGCVEIMIPRLFDALGKSAESTSETINTIKELNFLESILG